LVEYVDEWLVASLVSIALDLLRQSPVLREPIPWNVDGAIKRVLVLVEKGRNIVVLGAEVLDSTRRARALGLDR
jgi:hypothetical protein